MQGSRVEAWVIGSLASDRSARLKEKCRWAGLGVSALDRACRSRVEAVRLGRNWAYAF